MKIFLLNMLKLFKIPCFFSDLCPKSQVFSGFQFFFLATLITTLKIYCKGTLNVFFNIKNTESKKKLYDRIFESN